MNLLESLKLYHDNVLYVPLEQGVDSEGEYVKYILGGKGYNLFRLNGEKFFAIRITNIEAPSPLPTRLTMAQMAEASADYAPDSWENLSDEVTDCINYPLLSNTALPYFYFSMRTGGAVADYEAENATILASRVGDVTALSLLPTDTSKVCVLRYKGHIVAVFNYSLM